MGGAYGRNRGSRDNSKAAIAEEERENKMMCFVGKHKRKSVISTQPADLGNY